MWEEPLLRHIKSARRTECRRFLKLYFLKGFSDGISRNANIIFAFPIILVPLAQGKPLVASTVFTALSIIDSVASSCVKEFNFGMNAAADYYSVITRIQAVLLLKEKEELPLN